MPARAVRADRGALRAAVAAAAAALKRRYRREQRASGQSVEVDLRRPAAEEIGDHAWPVPPAAVRALEIGEVTLSRRLYQQRAQTQAAVAGIIRQHARNAISATALARAGSTTATAHAARLTGAAAAQEAGAAARGAGADAVVDARPGGARAHRAAAAPGPGWRRHPHRRAALGLRTDVRRGDCRSCPNAGATARCAR
ncbi:MAG: hypothetical protein MZW92_18820 [Comamonadaceae bacterium]|nr:hypothetical protein [Comamonadaceae bacterium]